MLNKIAIDQRLSELIPSKNLLSETIRYALLGPGKRLRPRLLLATAETFGVEPLLALDPACAIEMVHTFSLIHDDLPCMDNDDFRRGRKAAHRAFPEPIALLAGDSLLSEAFLVLARTNLEPAVKLKLIEVLGLRVGKDGMADGQALDIHPEQSSFESLLDIQKKKTGDLFSCSLEFGAILAGEPRLFEMRSIGLHLGLAYQIRDDLEDASQFSDENKPTALSKLGPAEAHKLLGKCLQEIESTLIKLPRQGAPIASLLEPLFETAPDLVQTYPKERIESSHDSMIKGSYTRSI